LNHFEPKIYNITRIKTCIKKFICSLYVAGQTVSYEKLGQDIMLDGNYHETKNGILEGQV